MCYVPSQSPPPPTSSGGPPPDPLPSDGAVGVRGFLNTKGSRPPPRRGGGSLFPNPPFLHGPRPPPAASPPAPSPLLIYTNPPPEGCQASLCRGSCVATPIPSPPTRWSTSASGALTSLFSITPSTVRVWLYRVVAGQTDQGNPPPNPQRALAHSLNSKKR